MNLLYASASKMKNHLEVIFGKMILAYDAFMSSTFMREFYGDMVNVWIQKKKMF